MPVENLSSYPRIATLVQSYITAVEDAQADHFAEHLKYFQGTNLVDGKPNGVQNVTTNANSKPTDQEMTWREFDPVVFALGITLPMNIKIEVYVSAIGWGYKLIFEFWPDEDLGADFRGASGNHWIYIHHVGPVAQNDYLDVWFVIDDDLVI